MASDELKISIISGGTATNELVLMFKSLSPKISYILPILDNGGSTSEIIRVIGGPAIGDIRSRLTRLIPENQQELKNLLNFRLSADATKAKAEWNEIVDGTHRLWAKINPSTKEIFRSFFIHVHVELLKRSKHQFSLHPTKKLFRYELANVGNLFLTGVRLFIGSLDSAIELWARLTGIDPNSEILPCINTNFTYHISALLENGLIITGQSQISHPSPTDAMVDNYPPPINRTRPPTPTEELVQRDYFANSVAGLRLDVPLNEVAIARSQHENGLHQVTSIDSYVSDSDEESGNVPQYTHPELKKSQLHFNKTDNIEPLLSPIKRIFYISPYGEEICPIAHSKVISNLTNSNVIIYSIGSLMTSIVPVIILKGVGRAIAQDIQQNPESKKKKRILLLNGCQDRETFGMDSASYIEVIVNLATYSLQASKGKPTETLTHEWNKYVTHLVYMKDPKIKVDSEFLQKEKGIPCIEVEREDASTDHYDLNDLKLKLSSIIET